MITLLVDKIEHDYKNEHKRSDRVHISTPGFEGNNYFTGWHPANIDYINFFSESIFFDVKNIGNFNTIADINSFYVISIASSDSWESQPNGSSIWNKIPQVSKDKILKHNIPILLFYPFETTSGDQETFANFVKEKDKNGFKDIKTVLFSLSNFNNYWGNPVTGSYTNHNIYYVSSSLFFDRMKNYLLDDRLASQFCSKKEASSKTNLKKYDFLCLNHISRINRQLLSQALYRDSSLWNNNLISVLTIPVIKSEVRLKVINRFYSFIRDEKNLIEDSKIHNFFEVYDPNLIFSKLKMMSHDPKLSEQDLIDELLSVNKEFKNSKLLNFIAQQMAGIMYKGVYPRRTMENEKNFVEGDQVREDVGLNDTWEKDWYKDSWFSLITETVTEYDSRPNPIINLNSIAGSELTEKVTKPIANFHPFIVFGSSGATKKLEKLGFKTFNKSLLGIPDDFEEGNISMTERLMNLIEGLKKFQAKNYNEKQEILNSIESDIEHNYYHLVNTDWIKVAHDELLKNDLPLLPIDNEEMIS